ncbi:MAG: DoxX-like family protein [Planctomycetota bacterium]
MQSRSWTLKLGLSCFWLTTGLFIAKEFYLYVQFYYLKFFLTHIGGPPLFQFFQNYIVFKASLLEITILSFCFLELLAGFYVLIYPPFRLLIGLQIFLLIPIVSYAIIDPSLWYHPFGALSKTFCIFAVLLGWRQLYIHKRETQTRKTLLWTLSVFWIYEGIVHLSFQTPFLLNPQHPENPLDPNSILIKIFFILGGFQIFSGIILRPLYSSRYRRMATVLVFLHLLFLIAFDFFYLYQVFYYLYHPLGAFTKDFVIVAIYLYLLQDPLTIESKPNESITFSSRN